MLVKRIQITDFRNIEKADVRFSEGVNLLVGNNAQGKTNIIEALWLFCGAKSFRGAKDSSFVKFGTNGGKNKISFISGGAEHTARMVFGEKRTAYLDSNMLKSGSELAGALKAVVFSPADIMLINGGPDKRRHFLDVSIGQLLPSYISVLRGYNRAVMPIKTESMSFFFMR